ncbi:hypothetical protein Gpo141_00014932, partial [Globisporangium polare]
GRRGSAAAHAGSVRARAAAATRAAQAALDERQDQDHDRGPTPEALALPAEQARATALRGVQSEPRHQQPASGDAEPDAAARDARHEGAHDADVARGLAHADGARALRAASRRVSTTRPRWLACCCRPRRVPPQHDARGCRLLRRLHWLRGDPVTEPEIQGLHGGPRRFPAATRRRRESRRRSAGEDQHPWGRPYASDARVASSGLPARPGPRRALLVSCRSDHRLLVPHRVHLRQRQQSARVSSGDRLYRGTECDPWPRGHCAGAGQRSDSALDALRRR